MDFNLSHYLKKFEKFLPYEVQVRNAVIQSIQDVLGIVLERSQVKVSRGFVFINGPAPLKTEINLKQASILARVKEIIPEITISKIT